MQKGFGIFKVVAIAAGIFILVVLVLSVVVTERKHELPPEVQARMMEQEKKNLESANTSSEHMMEDGSMMHDEDMMDGAMMKAGSYEAYAPEKLARANEGDVVLFFRASWCPSCRAVDSDIKAHLGDIPDSLTILDVNYDTERALKQKYGVTYQHTFVQVDAGGNQIAKWSGSPTLADIVSRVQ